MRNHGAKRGNYTLIAAAGLPVLLGLAAITIDASRVQLARSEVKMAAESIAHSALISMKDGDNQAKVRRKAHKVGLLNDVDGDTVDIRAQKHVEFGTWDFDNKTWSANPRAFNSVRVVYGRNKDHREGPLDMVLTPFMGTHYIDIQDEAATVAAFRPRDICIAVDVTASFAGEMPDARKAALALLQSMDDHYIYNDQVCMVAFVGDGQVFTGLEDVREEKTTIASKWDGSFWGKSGPVTGEKQWYFQEGGRHWGWTGNYGNIWDGTYSKVQTGTKQLTKYKDVFSHYRPESFTVNESYVTTEDYTVPVKVTYNEAFQESYACKKTKTIQVPYNTSYTVMVPYTHTFEERVPYTVSVPVEKTKQVPVFKRREVVGTQSVTKTRSVPFFKRYEQVGTETFTNGEWRDKYAFPVFKGYETAYRDEEYTERRYYRATYEKYSQIGSETAFRTETYKEKRVNDYSYEKWVQVDTRPGTETQTYLEKRYSKNKYESYLKTGTKTVTETTIDYKRYVSGTYSSYWIDVAWCDVTRDDCVAITQTIEREEPVYGWTVVPYCSSYRSDCRKTKIYSWIETTYCGYWDTCRSRTRTVTIDIPIMDWKAVSYCTPSQNCRRATGYSWRETRYCGYWDTCRTSTRQVAYDKPIMKWVPIGSCDHYRSDCNRIKTYYWQEVISCPMWATCRDRTRVVAYQKRIYENKYYWNYVRGSHYVGRYWVAFEDTRPVYDWVHYDSAVAGSVLAGYQDERYTIQEDVYGWVQHDSAVSGAILSHYKTVTYVENEAQTRFKLVSKSESREREETRTKTLVRDEVVTYDDTCTREATRTAVRWDKETRTRSVTKVRTITKYRDVPVMVKQPYTVEIPVYEQQKNYQLEKLYDWIDVEGGIAWGPTTFTKDYGLTWCDSRCGVSSIKNGKMYGAHQCSDSYAGNLWHEVWTDPVITKDVQKATPGAQAEHWAVQMPHCGMGGGNTNQGTGLDAAIDEILLNGSNGAMRHIALMSDGEATEPSPYWANIYGTPNLRGHSAQTWGHVQADDGWDNHDISISAVSFNEAPNAEAQKRQSQYLRSLTRGHGHFHETPNATELSQIMTDIGKQMDVVLVQ